MFGYCDKSLILTILPLPNSVTISDDHCKQAQSRRYTNEATSSLLLAARTMPRLLTWRHQALMAKTTIVAAMFTVCERERSWRARGDGGGSGGEKLLVWKREKMNRRCPSITRASEAVGPSDGRIGCCVRPYKWTRHEKNGIPFW